MRVVFGRSLRTFVFEILIFNFLYVVCSVVWVLVVVVFQKPVSQLGVALCSMSK
jgi:hypothetical protein